MQHHLHLVPTQRADVIQDQSGDDVNTVGLVGHNASLKHRYQQTDGQTGRDLSGLCTDLHRQSGFNTLEL